jgi:hypothetical protein
MHQVRVELSRREEIAISLVIAAVAGALFSGLFVSAYSLGPALSVVRRDLIVENQQTLNGLSLGQRFNGSTVFPPPLYVFEWIKFEVDLSDILGGVVEVNLTRDGQVLQTMLCSDTLRIVLQGFGEYRFGESFLDVTFRALDGRVTISTVYVSVSRGTNFYNPFIGAISVPFFVSLFVIPLSRRRKPQATPQKAEGDSDQDSESVQD